MFNTNDRDRQAEFFSDLPDTTKKTKKRGFKLGKVAISLSYENLIILAIGLIMMLIVCYSLGVERGKHLAQLEPEGIKEIEQERVQKAPPQKSPEPEQKRIRIKVASSKEIAKTFPYIQVASFRTQKHARKEMELLKDRGFWPFTLTWGRYKVVCVGGYKNDGEASRDFKQLRKVYADCILRNE